MALFFRDPVAFHRFATDNNVSIKSVCDRSGIAQTTFYRWLRGLTSPTIKTAELLGAALEEIISERRRTLARPTSQE